MAQARPEAEVAILVVGSTMTDMISYVDRVPAAGETVVGMRYAQGFGGKGANQAVMASRLGAAVSMVNQVGDDVLGDMTIENLIGEGIDVSRIGRVAGVSSGVAPIWVERDGTNRIIVVPGANDHVTAEQAGEAVEGAADVDVVLGQFEIPQLATVAAFEAARRRGAATVLNPAPAARILPELLAATDWLIPNETEFAFLAAAAGMGGQITPEAVAACAAELGVNLVVTLGAAGAIVCSDGDTTRVAAPAVEALDTTGAGDAFVGAFAYGLARHLTPVAAADLACRCASLSVSRSGTQSSFPSREEAAEIRNEPLPGLTNNSGTETAGIMGS